MSGFGVNIVVEDGKLNEVLSRLARAQEEIQQCYFELERMGVLVIKKPLEKQEDTANADV